jgi:hypothetical protein
MDGPIRQLLHYRFFSFFSSYPLILILSYLFPPFLFLPFLFLPFLFLPFIFLSFLLSFLFFPFLSFPFSSFLFSFHFFSTHCVGRLMRDENFEYLDNVIQMMSYFTYYSTGMYVRYAMLYVV